MKVLYVTSFNEKMFVMTGQRLLKTFLGFKLEGDLLIGYEGFDLPSVANWSKNPQIKLFNVMEHEYLVQWLEKYKDYIPVEFGGNAEIPKDKNNPKFKLQKKVYQYWNRKASLWFRKVASLHYAWQKYEDDYDVIIWIDSDCYFVKPYSLGYLEKVIGKNDLFYHQGPIRESVDYGFETGLIGFKKGKGYMAMETVFKFYESGKFISLNRWDDGYVFRHCIKNLAAKKIINAIDLVDTNVKGKRYAALAKGPFMYLICHDKGVHQALFDFNTKTKV